jgi:hypothetical protein
MKMGLDAAANGIALLELAQVPFIRCRNVSSGEEFRE